MVRHLPNSTARNAGGAIIVFFTIFFSFAELTGSTPSLIHFEVWRCGGAKYIYTWKVLTAQVLVIDVQQVRNKMKKLRLSINP
jgi:hypothetical protein